VHAAQDTTTPISRALKRTSIERPKKTPLFRAGLSGGGPDDLGEVMARALALAHGPVPPL